jgi:glucan biosynthesis protein C
MTEQLPNLKKRSYDLDYLRLFIVFIVIVLHSLLPFVMTYDWKINDVIKTFEFSVASRIIDVFIMPVMFYIAGYFAFPSIRKGMVKFISGKITRILIPFAIGVVFLAPIIAYYGLLQHNVINMSFPAYWTTYYFNHYIDQQHFWFLSSLFLFFMVFAVVYALFKSKFEKVYEAAKTRSPSGRNIAIFLAIMVSLSILLYYFAGRVYPDGSWISLWGIFPFQVTRWTAYCLYFIVGIVAYVKRVDIGERLSKYTFSLSCATFFMVYVYCDYCFSIYFSPDKGYLKPDIQFFYAVVHVLFCFGMVITLLTLFKYFNRPSKIFERLAKNSFTIYIVHMVYTVVLQYYVVQLSLDVFSKFMIILVGTVVLSVATSEAISLIGKIGKIGSKKEIIAQ